MFYPMGAGAIIDSFLETRFMYVQVVSFAPVLPVVLDKKDLQAFACRSFNYYRIIVADFYDAIVS